MSWFLKIFNITLREELWSKIYELEKRKKELEEEVDELECELSKAEDLAESWKSCFFIFMKNEGECSK